MIALNTFGPAVLHGGATTLIALVFLSLANSYPYIVVLKVFSMGASLVLPVMLIFCAS